MSKLEVRSWRKFNLSLDAWAVLAAFTLAAFVRAGVLKHIPW